MGERHDNWFFRAGPFALSDSVHRRGTELPRHSHPTACIHLILQGIYQEIIERRAGSFVSGTVLYKPPDIEHCNSFEAGEARSLRIEVDASEFRGLRPESGIPADPLRSTNPMAVSLASKIYGECAHPDAFTSLSAEGLCLELLVALCRDGREPKACPQPVEAVVAATEMLRSGFRQTLQLSELAAQAGVNRSVLARAFRVHHHCTMGEFVRRLRVTYAARLLAESNQPLAELGQDAGFADQSHFSRVFKRVIGISPAAYRLQFSTSHKRSRKNSILDAR